MPHALHCTRALTRELPQRRRPLFRLAVPVAMGLLALLAVVAPATGQDPAPGLPGSWAAGPLTLTFEGDGGWLVALDGTTAATGTYELAADTVTLHDRGGPRACPPGMAGIYTWSRSADTLTLAVVDDPCDGRRGAFTRPWLALPPQLQALVGATLIDGTGTPARPGMTLVIEEGRIRDVFADGATPLPAGARRIELAGHWVIPGLIDTHVHIATDPSRLDARPLVLDRLRRTLRGGVTTIRDMGGDARVLAGLAREAALGEVEAPFIVYGAIVAGPGFFADPRVVASTRGAEPGGVAWARALDDQTALPLVVAEAKGAGARALKLYADLRSERIAAVVNEAHRQGLAVWSHAALFPARPSDVVAAGADVVSHAALLAWEAAPALPDYRQRGAADYDALPRTDPAVDAVLRTMARQGTVLEPTLFVYSLGAERAAAAAWAARATRRAHELGVLIVAGTDKMIGAGADALPNLHEELALLVGDAGLSPLEAIRAATAQAAAALGMHDRGVLAPGMAADLVVLERDPSADITNTRAVAWVMKNGRRVGAAPPPVSPAEG